MALLGKQIQLRGLSQKGKNRVRDHGSQWVVLAETDSVLFMPDLSGQWLFIAPVGQGQNDKASRWIRAVEDKDFAVTIVET